jgi:hypothetical protein
MLHCVLFTIERTHPLPPLLKIEGETNLFLKTSIISKIANVLDAPPLLLREGIKG